ncbi:hypothetical protein EMIT0P43_60106 [Pseudomonas jessenii]
MRPHVYADSTQDLMGQSNYRNLPDLMASERHRSNAVSVDVLVNRKVSSNKTVTHQDSLLTLWR